MPENLPTRRHNDRERIDQALLALVVTGGNARHAAAHLEAAGIQIPERTIRDWRTKHAERYQELQDRHGPELEQAVVRSTRERVIALDHLEGDLIESLHADINQLAPKDKSAALKNATLSKGINVDKLLVLTNRPTVITDHRSAEDINKLLAQTVKELKELGVDVDTIEDADIIPD